MERSIGWSVGPSDGRRVSLSVRMSVGLLIHSDGWTVGGYVGRSIGRSVRPVDLSAGPSVSSVGRWLGWSVGPSVGD